MDVLERPLPHDADAERLLLGCVLLIPETLAQIREGLLLDDFFIPSHRCIYSAYIRLADTGTDVNPVTVCDDLRRTGEIDAVGGAAYVATLFDGCPRFSDVRSYVQIVRDKGTLRRMINAANRVMREAFDAEDTAGELLAKARKEFDGIEDPNAHGNWLTMKQATDAYLNYVQERLESGSRFDGLATGIDDLDEELGGLPWGSITLLAARPGMGKTALATQIAIGAARSADNPPMIVLIFQMEMQNPQEMQRIFSLESCVPIRDLRLMSAWRDRNRAAALRDAQRVVEELPICVNYDTALTPARFAGEVRRMQRLYPDRKVLAIIDYAQRMRPDDRRITSAYDRASAISMGLTDATKDLGCVTIAAAQLNRDVQNRAGNRPAMSDLRDSGQWEQDAETIIAPHRPVYFNSEELAKKQIEEAELIILKGRNSGNAIVPVMFDPQQVRYVQKYQSYAPPPQQRVKQQAPQELVDDLGW